MNNNSAPLYCRSSGSITVSHPSRVLVAYQAVLALEEAGLLRHFETGLYFRPQGPLANLIAALPSGLGLRLSRELNRRQQTGVGGARVRSHPLWDTVFTVAMKLGLPAPFVTGTMLLRNQRFDGAVARHVSECRPAAVIGYDTSTLKTFEACAASGVVRILDQVIGHIAIGAPLLEEEKRLHPEWSDSIPLHGLESTVKRCLAEARLADWVLVPSNYVHETLCQVGVDPAKIRLLPYGVDVDRFRPGPLESPRPFRVLFVGQLSQRKGLKYLLEAWKRLQLRNAELVLVGTIVGRGGGLAPYQGLYRHLQSVPYSELHSYYQGSDVFVFPSLHEGTSLAVLEAMASELPVITTRNAGSPVRDGEEGFIVPIRDVDTIAQKIQTLYNNKDLARSMGRKARQRVEQQTWQHYRNRLVEHLRSMLGSKARGD